MANQPVKTDDKSIEELRAELTRLQGELSSERKARTEAEEMAQAVAQASPFLSSNTEEQPTGKTIKLNVCVNPWVREEKEQKFKDVDVPTFFYAIDLPAGAGISLSTNGMEYYHGQTYEIDLYTLADLKSRVARCWDHEKSIHGENENAYRRQTNKHLMGSQATH